MSSQYPPDPKVIEFATKLAALMREYDAVIEVIEESRNWENYAVGFDINLSLPRDYERDGVDFVEIRSTYASAVDIESVLGDQ